MTYSDSHPYYPASKPPINTGPLHAALIAWRKAERRHAALVLGLIQPHSSTETDDAHDSADKALHEVRKLVDSTLSSSTP